MNFSAYTWDELQKLISEGKDALIIPVGTCEQHSVHLPLMTDTITAEWFATKLSEETGYLVAPTINYGVNLPCDSIYTGTNTITENTLHQHVQEMLVWWKQQGFKRFHFLSAHGDIFHIKAISETEDSSVFCYELYEANYAEHLEKQQSCKHACEAETSVMMYLFPELVRKDKIVDFCTPIEDFMPYIKHIKTEPIKNSPGVQGYPSKASKEKGEKIVQIMLKELFYKFYKNTTKN